MYCFLNAAQLKVFFPVQPVFILPFKNVKKLFDAMQKQNIGNIGQGSNFLHNIKMHYHFGVKEKPDEMNFGSPENSKGNLVFYSTPKIDSLFKIVTF